MGVGSPAGLSSARLPVARAALAGYSGSPPPGARSQARLSSLRAGRRGPWKRRHSGQTRTCAQPRATSAASRASRCASCSGSPAAAPHSCPLLSVAVARGRRSSGMGGPDRSPARRRRGRAPS